MGLTILQRAIDRGDLPHDADIELMLDIAAGVPMAQLFRLSSVRDERDIEPIVDLLLRGAMPRRRRDKSRHQTPETP
jgi:hypothetical protein